MLRVGWKITVLCQLDSCLLFLYKLIKKPSLFLLKMFYFALRAPLMVIGVGGDCRFSIVDFRLSHMDASSCYRKLEGLPVAFTGKPTSKEKLALAVSGFRRRKSVSLFSSKRPLLAEVLKGELQVGCQAFGNDADHLCFQVF